MQTAKNVKIADIEKELERLWEGEEEKNKTKACLFNLIIYTHEPRRTQYFSDVIRSVIKKFPCRILFIQGDHPEANHLSVDVSHAAIGEGKDLIACDQIIIKVGADRLPRVPYIILPHLIPDLPIFLLWGQDPTSENAILPHLMSVARRLIFDSECTDSLQNFSCKVLKEVGSVEIMDVHWALISGWRDAISRVFALPETLEQLRHTKRVQITYNALPSDFVYHTETQAIYLQGWLASQLGWQYTGMVVENGKRTIKYEEDGPVEVVLESKCDHDFYQGSILSVEFASRYDHFVIMKAQKRLPKVIVHVSTLEKCDLPFTLSLPDLQKGFAFMKEIFYQQTSLHYENMLKMISQSEWS